MRKNNLVARRNVRNSKQALVESIMAKVAPIVKNALNEKGYDTSASYTAKAYAVKFGETIQNCTTVNADEIAEVMLDILDNDTVYEIVDAWANAGLIDNDWYEEEFGY